MSDLLTSDRGRGGVQARENPAKAPGGESGTSLACRWGRNAMWTSVCLILALSVLHATTAWAGGWNEPAQVLGLAWGAPVEAAKQQFPGGRLSRETASTLAYTAATHLDGIPLSASFQFVSEEGLQGVVLRFPVHRLVAICSTFFWP